MPTMEKPLWLRRMTVSDLFFNHEHPTFTALFDGSNVEQSEVEAAIMEDAMEFYEAYGDILEAYMPGAGIDAAWLADDFMKRL